MSAATAAPRIERTSLEDTPNDWEVVRLGEIYRERKEAGVPGLPVMSVTLDEGLVPRDSLGRRVESDLAPSQHALAADGDLVYNTMRMWQGASGVATVDCMVSPAYVVAQPNGRIDPSFACFLFKAPSVIGSLFSYSHGITRDRLRLYYENFQEVPIALPPLAEQRKIAAILSSVDNAITATRKVIEQTKRLKQGLLQTLMTRGIGHARFKKTEIGEIPEAWDVASLKDLGVWASGTTPSKSEKSYWGGSVPWITPKDMKVSIIRSSQDRITHKAVSTGARLLETGAVLVVVRGMILAHTFPVAVTEVPVTINQDMKALVPNERIDVSFLLSWLQLCEKDMLARVSEATHGTKRLPLVELLSFPIPLPPRAEQEEIAEKFTVWRAQLQNQYHSMKQLQQLKRGLLQDLLTGRVRVPLD